MAEILTISSGWTTSVAWGGTKGYQSAEIIGEGPPTTAADVYAFAGVILAVHVFVSSLFELAIDTTSLVRL